jgi:hypothetical protein
MFTEQLNAIFADYITNGVINCEPDVFKNGLDKILQEYTPKESTVGKRLPSNFMVWMKTIRHTIIEEFFSEFDSYSDWSKEGTIEYYKQTELPLDKLKILITKKEKQGKTTFKPRLVSLITTKAGQIWSTLDDDEKAKYKIVEDANAEDTNAEDTNAEDDNAEDTNAEDTNAEEIIEPSRKLNKKKGRPKGKRPKNSVSDAAIMNSIQLMNTLNNIDEEVDVDVDEFEYNGVNYYKDISNNVYSFDECNKIGKITDGELKLIE